MLECASYLGHEAGKEGVYLAHDHAGARAADVVAARGSQMRSFTVDVHDLSPNDKAKICYLSARRIGSPGRSQSRGTIVSVFVSGNRNRCRGMAFLPVQSRMARAGLGWGIRELARAAKVSVDTVVRFERGEELKERTVEALQRAFEAAGLEFMNGDHPGLRLGSRVAAGRLSEQTGVAAPEAEQNEFWNNPPKPRKER